MTDFDYKTLTDEELSHIFEGRKFGIEMKHHQLVSLAFAADLDPHRVMFPHDVGTCKTLTALEVARHWGCKRILVVCPGSAFSSWEGDTNNYTDYSFTLLIGTKDERRANLAKRCNISVINYEGLKSLYAKLYDDIDSDGHGKWIMNEAAFKDAFDCVIFDEIHRVSNYKSLTSQICLQLSRRTKNVIGLSGTPFDKSMLELFNIYMMIDLGRSLGTNFYQYRYSHFDPPKWGYEWKLKPGAREKILSKISTCTIRYSRQECFDLPELHEIDLVVQPTDEFLELQKCVIDGKQLHIGEQYIDTVKPEAKAVVLRELVSGFIYYGDDKNVYTLKGNPKLDALIDIVQDTRAKLIVYHQFITGASIIEAAFNKAKIKFVPVRGGQSQQQRKDYIDAFINDPNIPVMLAHPKCAAEGFNGTVADTVIFFDQVASPRIRKQCTGRIHRSGQTKKCLAIYLALDKSLDKTTMKHRNDNITEVEAVMEFIREFHHEKGGRIDD